MGKCQSFHSEDPSPYKDLGVGTSSMRNKNRSYSFVEQTNLRLRTESFNRKFHLEFLLSNVKCKGLTSTTDIYLLKVFFPSQVGKAQLGTGNNPIFNLNQKVIMDVDYNQLETNYMEIIIYTLKKTIDADSLSKKPPEDLLSKAIVYSSIRFDFMTLIFGPMIYDVSLPSSLNNSINGRITFHLVSKQFNKVLFVFNNFKIKITKQDLILTNPAIKTYLHINNKINQSVFVSLREKNNEGREKEYYGELDAQIEHLLDFEYFHESFPIICLYNQTKNKYSLIAFSPIILKNEIKQIIKNKNKQVNIFFNKLLGNIPPSTIIETLPYDFNNEFLKELNTKMFWNGEKIGEISLKFNITNIPLISQLPCGIYTEKGLVTNSYAIYKYFPCSKQSFASYSYIHKQLHAIKNQLCNKVMKQKVEINEKKDSTFHLSLEFSEIKHLLEHSIDDNILFYQYETFEDIYDAQEAFLVIGNQIIEILNQLSIDETLSGLDIIKLVGQRGEFEQTIVAEAWFISSVSNIQSSKPGNSYVMSPEVVKRNLIIKFLTFLRNCLDFFQSSTETTQRKGYYLSFCANVFFKFPLFRDKITQSMLLDISLKPQDTQGIPNDLELMDSFPESKILYWDKFFNCRMKESMTCLAMKTAKDPSYTQIINLKEELERKIMNEYTFNQISERGEFFFGLIKNIFDLAALKLSKNPKEVHWLSISAIPQILIAIAHELSKKEITKYPSNIYDILGVFVHEPLIINRLTKIIISKTNAYDSQSVYCVLTMIDSLFQAHHLHFSCPLQFDYSLLTKITKILFQIDNSITLSMILWLYYKNCHLLPIWHIIEITLVVFIPHFFKLFFHWSFKVRKMFYDFLLYILLYRLNDIIPYKNIEDDMGNETEEGHTLRKFSDLFDFNISIIKQIQEASIKENLDPNTKVKLNIQKYHNILQYVPKESLSIIALCLKEFNNTEFEFKEWKTKQLVQKSEKYPTVVISAPKDDVDI